MWFLLQASIIFAVVASMLADGRSWNSIQSITGCRRATIAKVAKRKRVASAAGVLQ